jgi:hypothetical protein
VLIVLQDHALIKKICARPSGDKKNGHRRGIKQIRLGATVKAKGGATVKAKARAFEFIQDHALIYLYFWANRGQLTTTTVGNLKYSGGQPSRQRLSTVSYGADDKRIREGAGLAEMNFCLGRRGANLQGLSKGEK